MPDRDAYVPESENEGPGPERRAYVTGALVSLALTCAAFGVVAFDVVTGNVARVVLALLALAQITAQFRYFLHIDLKNSHRDDLQLILFTGLIVALMIGGTTWILFDQHARM